jgi:hypothetical protein
MVENLAARKYINSWKLKKSIAIHNVWLLMVVANAKKM